MKQTTMRTIVCGLSLLWLTAGVSGCGSGKKKYEPAKVVPQSTQESSVEEVLVSREDVFMRKMKQTTFSGTRDLFESVNFVSSRGQSGGTPLESFELGQLKVVGIIWGTSRPWALVRAPDGVEYRATVNTPIGKNGGKIISILSDQIVVLEKFFDYRGELQQEKYTLRLPSSQGAYQ